MRHRELDALYAARDSLALTAAEVGQIVKVMDGASARYSLTNLRDCYAYDRWLSFGLERLNERPKDARYIQSFLSQVRDKSSLSPRQIQTAHNILGKFGFRRVPRVDAFAWNAPGGPNRL